MIIKNLIKKLPFVSALIPRVRRILNGGWEIRKNKFHKYAKKAISQKLPQYHCKRDKIALVVPCFKHADFLPMALKSILEQTKMPDEIIFINNASPDSTQKLLLDFKKTHPNLNIQVYLNSKNYGQAYSLNRGVSSAKSDLVMLLNDDDYLMHNAVEVACSLMQKYKDVHLCGFSCNVFQDDSEIGDYNKMADLDCQDFFIKTPKDIWSYKKCNDINMTHSGSIFTKYAWDIVGGFYSKKSERVVPFSDRDFQLRLNCYFHLSIFPNTKITFWRDGSSVDAGINS